MLESTAKVSVRRGVRVAVDTLIPILLMALIVGGIAATFIAALCFWPEAA